MSVTDASESDKLNLKSEAMVARAFEYLCMIGVYAPPMTLQRLRPITACL